jgi:hypothetical protein
MFALDKLKLKIKEFLFSNPHFEGLGLMRFLLCACLLYLAIFRQINIDQYTEISLIPRADALSVYPDFYRPYFQYFFWPDSMAPMVHWVYIVLMGLACVGLTNRPLMLVTWVLAQGFINRNYSMLFGADLIGTLFFFYLSFTHCTEYFSLKKYFLKNEKIHNPESFSDQLSAVAVRLMQVQISVIYMYTGFEKLKGTTWWDGTALWTVFANPQFASLDFIWMRHFPLFFAVGTFTTLIFEVYFPAAVLSQKYRVYWLLLGVLFHTSIGLLLGLMPFSLVMISTYFLFIDRLTLRRWSSLRFLRG